jgi:hypothetical protein
VTQPARDAPADLRRRIAEWLESEREAAVSAVRAASLPLSVTRWVPIATEVSETAAQTATEPREANPFATGEYITIRAVRDRKRPQPPASEVYAAYGERSEFQPAFAAGATFASDPAGWIRRQVLTPVTDTFIASVPRVDAPSHERALALADDLLAFVAGSTIRVRSELPLAGLRLDRQLHSGDARLRPLTNDEIAAFEHFDASQMDASAFLQRLSSFMPSGERVMLEVDEYLDKTRRREPTHALQKLVLALQLLGYELWGRGLALHREHPVGFGTLGTPIAIAKHGTWRDLPQVDLDNAVRLARLIPDDVFSDPRAPGEIALSRYSSACADRTATDALIDLVVALESTLLPREFEGELKFRLALYGAYATGAGGSERPEVYRAFAKAYDTRSDIVHGKRVEPEELRAVASTTKSITGRVLLRGLEQGWPTPDELRAAVLA